MGGRIGLTVESGKSGSSFYIATLGASPIMTRLRAMIRKMRLMILVLVGMALVSPAATAEGESGPYPIWWSPALELESLDQIEAFMGARFPVHNWFAVGEKDSFRSDTLVDNCRTLIRFTDRDYESVLTHETHKKMGVRCYALAALAKATPAGESYLRGFVLDEKAINVLPVMVGRAASGCDDAEEYLAANRDGVPWGIFLYQAGVGDQIRELRVIDENRLDVAGGFSKKWGTELKHDPDSEFVIEEIWMTTIQIYGRGDFSGDGLDDLLMRADTWGPRMQLRTRLYLVTRERPEAVLRVAWEYGAIPQEHTRCEKFGFYLALPDDRPYGSPEP